jgi:hypothetical protein
MRPPESTIQTEKLAYWYFRLNGCLTIENFIVHPDEGGSQRTDADILGVRFPHRLELLQNPMVDDAIFLEGTKPLLFVAEVKLRLCELNGPWKRPESKDMYRVLRAIGAFSENRIEEIAQALYQQHRYEDDRYEVRLIAIGDQRNERYDRERPDVIQVVWLDILKFIHQRFQAYPDQKRDHHQWDEVGHTLWRLCFAHEQNSFVTHIRSLLTDQHGNRLTVETHHDDLDAEEESEEE